LSIDVELQHIISRAEGQSEELRGRGGDGQELEFENQVGQFGELRTVVSNHVF